MERRLQLLVLLAFLIVLAPFGAGRDADWRQEPAADAGDVAAAPSGAEGSVVEAIIAEADENGQVMKILDELVNGIGPRLTSSSNLTEACRWAAQRMREWGIPEVRLEEWGTFPVGFDRGLLKGRIIQPHKQTLTFWTHAWTAGTDGPVRGPVRFAPKNDEELAESAGEYAGAWVLITSSGNDPRWDSDEDDFRSRLADFLDREGIAGTIRPGRRPGLVRTGGRHRVEWADLPTRVQVNLLREEFREIGALLEEGIPVEAEFEIQNRFVEGPIPLYNVIGEIPGTEASDELVIVGGHIDSWDGATGTQDNGTGTSTTLEAARILGKLGVRPRRTIRFMLWSGEEQGLLGSRAYIEAHPEENERISAVIAHDGGTNFISGICATEAMYPLMEQAFAPVVDMVKSYEDEEITFELREVDGLPRGIGSDHDSYLAARVPGFFWDQAQVTSYGFVHHTQNDLYEHAVAKYQEHSAKVVAIAAWQLANLPEMLPRDAMLPPPPRRLGVFLGDDGVTVQRVTSSGLAAKAGFAEGDKILEIDGERIANRRDLVSALRTGEARKTVVIERGDAPFEFLFDWDEETAVPVGAAPPEPQPEPQPTPAEVER